MGLGMYKKHFFLIVLKCFLCSVGGRKGILIPYFTPAAPLSVPRWALRNVPEKDPHSSKGIGRTKSITLSAFFIFLHLLLLFSLDSNPTGNPKSGGTHSWWSEGKRSAL